MEEEDNSENDEIHEELLRCQAELKAISAHNLQQLKRLTKAVRCLQLSNHECLWRVLHYK